MGEGCSCLRFVLARLFLMASDDGLHGPWELQYVLLTDVFFHLHGVFEGLIIGCVGEDHQRLSRGLTRQMEVGFIDRIRRHCEDAELHAARGCADGGRVHHRVDGEVIFAVIAVFLGGVNIAEDHAADLGDDGGGIYDGIAVYAALDVLLLVGEEVIDVPCASDVVLHEEAFERCAHRLAHGDLVHADPVRHEDHDVVAFCLDIVDVAHEVEELQDGYVLHREAVARLGCPLGALDDASDGAVEEGMHGVIEEVEGGERVCVLMLDFLRRLLKAGQHGALAAGEMRAGVAVLSDLSEDLLHEDELIGYEGEVPHKCAGVPIALDVAHRLGEAEEVSEDGVVLFVDGFQLLLGLRRFLQDAFLYDLVRRSR